MKGYFTIGEISTLFGLNVQTLHYYDSIGLLRPNKRDESTGRRYYAFDQVYKLASIRYMRRLGYSLAQIADYMDSLEVGFTLEHLKKRSLELRRQWEGLLCIENAIARKIGFIERSLQEIEDINGVRIKHYDERKYMLIGGEELLYLDDWFYFYPTIAFYRNGDKYFGAYLNPGGGDGFSVPPMANSPGPDQEKALPQGDYLCAYHQGPYEYVGNTERRLRGSHPELLLSDLTIDFNIIDQFVEKNSSNYITHMQIQILGRKTL